MVKVWSMTKPLRTTPSPSQSLVSYWYFCCDFSLNTCSNPCKKFNKGVWFCKTPSPPCLVKYQTLTIFLLTLPLPLDHVCTKFSHTTYKSVLRGGGGTNLAMTKYNQQEGMGAYGPILMSIAQGFCKAHLGTRILCVSFGLIHRTSSEIE